MKFKLLLLLVFCSFLQVTKTAAQVIRRDSIPLETRRDSSLSFFGVPLVFYTPDTRWGVGAAGIVTFPTRPRRSNLTFNVSYTQNKQILVFFPFQWLSHQNRFRVYGELGWYRYLYQYFGIGNKYPNNYVETYTAKFPRIRVTAAKRVQAKHLVGVRVFLDVYNIISASPDGEIAKGEVAGATGGISSSVGPVWISDSRDNSFYPRKGWLTELALTGEHRLTGSDYQYARCSLDVARYFPIGKNVLAINGIAMFTAGDVPFFQLPQIGGPSRLRGYPLGKYRDKNLLIAQAELRFPLVWRFKGVIFGGGGTVFGKAGESAKFRPNGGAGLRFEFDRRQKLHLRLDYGFGDGKGNSGLYITLGEAF
ncbi:MAG: BamA/TamA family outer membrane protein [Saprospiraceae bacterium]|nr:BamA/TamA family outer membrane protein [Saprospiraceae bacterium]